MTAEPAFIPPGLSHPSSLPTRAPGLKEKHYIWTGSMLLLDSSICFFTSFFPSLNGKESQKRGLLASLEDLSLLGSRVQHLRMSAYDRTRVLQCANIYTCHLQVFVTLYLSSLPLSGDGSNIYCWIAMMLNEIEYSEPVQTTVTVQYM